MLLKLKCESCSFSKIVPSGSTTGSKGVYVFFGCKQCKDIISLDVLNPKDKKSIDTLNCPNCRGKLIDYKSLAAQQIEKKEKKYPCPVCGNNSLVATGSLR